jgi:hypothetical protein
VPGGSGIDVLADIGRRAVRDAQGLAASISKPNRLCVGAPIHLRHDAVDCFQSVPANAIHFVNRLIVPFRRVVHDHRAALVEAAQHIVTGRSATVHDHSFSQVKQGLDAVRGRDDDRVGTLISFLNGTSSAIVLVTPPMGGGCWPCRHRSPDQQQPAGHPTDR